VGYNMVQDLYKHGLLILSKRGFLIVAVDLQEILYNVTTDSPQNKKAKGRLV
jgi:hypothetical protein